jgi:hypothetical protein
MSDEGSVSSEGETLPAISGVSTPSSVVTSNTFQPSASDSQQCFSRKGLVPSRSLVEPSKSVPSYDIRNYIPQPSSSSFSSPSCLPRQYSGTRCLEQSSSNGETATSQLQHISEMFPFRDHETISKTLSDANMNVEVAIDKLLGVTGINTIVHLHSYGLHVISLYRDSWCQVVKQILNYFLTGIRNYEFIAFCHYYNYSIYKRTIKRKNK